MQAMTFKYISDLCKELQPEIYYHPTAIAYIQYLVTPYAETIEITQNLVSWAETAFPGYFAQGIAKQIKSEPIATRKVAAVKYILADLIELSGNIARDEYGGIVLPWDIYYVISQDAELPDVFGIPHGKYPSDIRLPVTVNINRQPFIHDLSCEFTCALFLFSIITHRYFDITMFGQPFTDNHIPSMLSRFNYSEYNQNRYRVKIGGTVYAFRTTDFMQGLATGAMWENLDHHKYWSELNELIQPSDEEETEIEASYRPITF